MGDYSLAASHTTGMTGYGPGVIGSTFPRKVMSSLQADVWGIGISWNATQLRADISGISGTMNIRVYGSCWVQSNGVNGTVGLAVYKNGSNVSIGQLLQHLTTQTNRPCGLSVQWVGSVVNTDYIELYLIASNAQNLTIVSSVNFSVIQLGGSSMTTNTSLNSANPQWVMAQRPTSDTTTNFGTTAVNVINSSYLSGRTNSSGTDALGFGTDVINLLIIGVYQITVSMLLKTVVGTAPILSVRLSIQGIGEVARRDIQPQAITNAHTGVFIEYCFEKTTVGTTTVTVTSQSTVNTSYVIGSSSFVSVKLIRRDV